MSRLAQAHTDGSNGTDTLRRPFPLARLPFEIQLRIIACCVVSKIPIVNLGTKDWHWLKEEAKAYPWAQDHLTLNLLRTCRTYHDEGWKCFWRRNVFLYTSPEALAKVTDWSPYSTRISSLSMLRHVSVRVAAETIFRQPKKASDNMIRTLFGCLQDCWLFSALDRLQIDFIVPKDPEESGYTPVTTQNPDIAQIIEASRVYKERQIGFPSRAAVAKAIGKVTTTQPRSANFGGPKQEIVITGLPENDEHKLEALALRLISTTITPHGRIGFGRGAEGRRYWYEADKYGDSKIMEGEPAIKWVAAEGLEEWITTHGIHDASSAQSWISRLFFQVDRCDPFFKGWA